MQKLQAPIAHHLQPSIFDKGLVFKIKELDRFFRKLKHGEFIVFHGSSTSHIISELLCVNSHLSHSENRSKSSIIFIDGGNIFDPYFISKASHYLGSDSEKILKNIWISRAFTSHQMTTLIMEKLPQILGKKNSEIVLISNITALYCESDVGISETRKTFNRVVLFLWNLAKRRDILLIVTSFSRSRSEKKRCLEHYLFERADAVFKIEHEYSYVNVASERHSSQLLTSIQFFNESYDQLLLENFMEV